MVNSGNPPVTTDPVLDSSPTPLTHENLKLLETAMASEGSRTLASSSRSKSTGSDKSNASLNAVSWALTANNIFDNEMDNSDLEDGGKQVVEIAKETRSQERGSQMGKEEVAKIYERYRRYRSFNEDTLHAAIYPKIIPFEDRKVRIDNSMGLDEDSRNKDDACLWEDKSFSQDGLIMVLNDACLWEDKSFSQDGLIMVLNDALLKDSIPLRQGEDELEQCLLKQHKSRIKDVKPDSIYGFDVNIFPKKIQMLMDVPPYTQYARISPSAVCPFMIEEWKSSAGNDHGGVQQLCCGASALVAALDNTYELANQGDTSPEECSRQSMIFSLLWTYKRFVFSVHWTEIKDDERCFYWKSLVDESISKESIPLMRRTMHNILDWGATVRKPEIEALYTKLLDIPLKGKSKRKSKSVTSTTTAQSLGLTKATKKLKQKRPDNENENVEDDNISEDGNNSDR